MPRLAIGLLTAIAFAATSAGCRNSPPPPVAVPDRVGGNPHVTVEHDPIKPMPAERGESNVPPPPAPLAPPSPVAPTTPHSPALGPG